METISRYTNEICNGFEALADPTRRRVVEALSVGPLKASELAVMTNTSPSRMSKHLKVLLSAGITVDERPSDDARVRIFHLRQEGVAPMQDWLAELQATWDERLLSFKQHAETRKETEQ